jgi:NAD(P)-dependent dehydrogenase (short-subunit alcohol dehydrogenase family)
VFVAAPSAAQADSRMSRVDLDGKVAIITGAAGGIGKVLVPAFLEAGAVVAALDVNRDGLAALEGASRDSVSSGRLRTDVCDISDHEACEAAVADVIDGLGGVHILINNGALGMGEIRDDHMTRLVTIDEITPSVWQRFAMVNFSGPWYMTRAVIGPMMAQRWGRIITVTTSFFTMLRGSFHPYGPCKAGLEAMCAGHAKEFEGSGVTVNIVVPGGPADTPMVPQVSGLERGKLIAPRVMGPPMLWLCSDAAGDITGNRYLAVEWDTDLSPDQAERRCRAPIAWPGLAGSPVWPGGRPDD